MNDKERSPRTSAALVAEFVGARAVGSLQSAGRDDLIDALAAHLRADQRRYAAAQARLTGVLYRLAVHTEHASAQCGSLRLYTASMALRKKALARRVV